jgi:hypothetical protein
MANLTGLALNAALSEQVYRRSQKHDQSVEPRDI